MADIVITKKHLSSCFERNTLKRDKNLDEESCLGSTTECCADRKLAAVVKFTELSCEGLKIPDALSSPSLHTTVRGGTK